MVRELLRVLPRTAGTAFIDQAVHNHLLWTAAFKDVATIENGAGPVFTMHGVLPAGIRSTSDGHLADGEGRIIPVLHQFDRYPDHAARLRTLLT
jgi:hypothetical protein